MAVTVSGSVRFLVDIYERVAGDLGVASARHLLDYSKTVESGTGGDQADVVWSDRGTATAAAVDIDVRGALASALNAAIQFVKITGIIIRNKSTTAGAVLIVGNDAAAVFAGLFNAAGDRIKIQPGGCFAWFAPQAGDTATTTAVTADVIQLDPGANTVEYEIILLGRTA